MLLWGIKELTDKEGFFHGEAQHVQYYKWHDVVDAMIKWVRVVISAEGDGAAPGALLQRYIASAILWRNINSLHLMQVGISDQHLYDLKH